MNKENRGRAGIVEFEVSQLLRHFWKNVLEGHNELIAIKVLQNTFICGRAITPSFNAQVSGDSVIDQII